MSLSSTGKEIWNAGPGPQTKKEYIIHMLKGFMMGTADLIPGVSGGTMAFITGIYGGLLAAISSVNLNVLKLLLKFQFKEALSQIHLRFIIPLGIGLLTAIFSLARLMHYLIKEQPVPTWALFFGLILASIIIIWRQLDDHFNIKNLLVIALGALFSWVVVGLIPVTTPDGLWFVFLCGVIGITAMILPGISGSFLLLILGKYEYITGAIKNPFMTDHFFVLITFSIGSATGLLGFSRILNWLLGKYNALTMGFLTGILIGSMRKVWPWKEVLETQIIRGKVKTLREANVMPVEFNSEFYIACGLVLVGFGLIIAMDIFSRHKKSLAEQ
jgi:putative membrane protein